MRSDGIAQQQSQILAVDHRAQRCCLAHLVAMRIVQFNFTLADSEFEAVVLAARVWKLGRARTGWIQTAVPQIPPQTKGQGEAVRRSVVALPQILRSHKPTTLLALISSTHHTGTSSNIPTLDH